MMIYMPAAIPIKLRFKNKIKKLNGCWNWTGAVNQNGYGWVWFNGGPKGTHRVAWQIYRGPIPKGKQVLHRCDNPPCVNPAHLFIGTNRRNVDDKVKKGRQSKGENGLNKLSEKNVIQIFKLLSDPSNTYMEISKKFGVGQRQIYMIAQRKNWKHLKIPEGIDESAFLQKRKTHRRKGAGVWCSRLSEKDVFEIKRHLATDSTRRSVEILAAKFGVSFSAIDSIKYGRTWGHICWLGSGELPK